MNSQAPQLSVVIVVASDARHLKGCLEALTQQVDPPYLEIIVPYLAHDEEVVALQSQFPSVRWHPVDKLLTVVNQPKPAHEHLNELRATGLSLALGDIIVLTEDHARPDRRWARNIVQEHKDSSAAIGGAIENEVDRLLNWAVYFCDFSRYQNPVQTTPSRFLTDANVSYKRLALEKVKEVWRSAYHETEVHDALAARNQVLRLSPNIVVYQHREKLNLWRALKERIEWARSYAAFRAKQITPARRLFYLTFSPGLVFLLTGRKIAAIARKKRLIREFIKAFPLTALLTLFWSYGELLGYLTGRCEPTSKT